MKNLRSIINKPFLLVLSGLLSFSGIAQEVIVTDSTAIQEEPELAALPSATNTSNRVKVDGVAAVVGDYVVLNSDIDKMYIDLQSQGVSVADVDPCSLAGRLLENKLYAHHAIQDSIVVPEAEINGTVDQKIGYMAQELGSMEKVLEFYQKDSEVEFRTELYTIIKENLLATKMQRTIVEAVEITPEEVREFYSNIAPEDRPLFGDEVEIAQIVIKPEIPESEKQELLRRLNEYRADVVDNGASFATKAVLYSQDHSTRPTGGKITLAREDPFVKEFKDAAFSLQEGEVSKPFESMFGYHILTVDKIRGQQRDVRHILLIPDVTEATRKEARAKIDSIRQRIIDGEMEFAVAAREFSDQEETRNSGGQLINPTTGDTRFELSKLDPVLYTQVVDLKEGEVSYVVTDQDETGRPVFKLYAVTKRYPEHIADYAKDFNKIKELALRDKQLEAIEKWQAEKIGETYIKINGEFRDCQFSSNWLKK